MYVQFRAVSYPDDSSAIPTSEELYRVTLEMDDITSFSDVAEDGISVSTEVIMKNGAVHTIHLPYDQFYKLMEKHNEIIRDINTLLKRN